MHITITGDLGSGKSTVAKELCRILGYTYLSTGQIQRNLAKEMGMDTLEFNRFTDQNLHIDDYIDNKVKEINQIPEPHVLDSRLAWHFVKASFKIYLMALDEVAASRVLKDDTRLGEPDSKDLSSKIKELKERRESENKRFASNYGIKPSLFQDFDAIVDTSTANVEEVTQLLIQLYNAHQEKKPETKIWLSPIRVLPVRVTDSTAFLLNQSTSKDWKHLDPVQTLLYKREFYVFKGLSYLQTGLKQKFPFIPVVLKGREGDKKMLVETFVREHFFEEDLKLYEQKYQFKYIRQQVV